MTHKFHKENVLQRMRARRARRSHDVGGKRVVDILLLVFIFLALGLFGIMVVAFWG